MANPVIDTVNLNDVTYDVKDRYAERTINKVDAFTSNPSADRYPSEKLLKTELDKKENLANKITTFENLPANDNTSYPTAKLVKDTIDSTVAALTGNIDALDFTPYELKNHRVFAFQAEPSNDNYPSEKLVKDNLDALSARITEENEALSGRITSGRTAIVSTLPDLEDADENTNYVQTIGDGALLYKKINDAWVLISGSKAYVENALPATGDVFTEYYIPNPSGDNYLHYRWKNAVPADPENGIEGSEAGFYSIGSDAYSKDEINEINTAFEVLTNKTRELTAASTHDQYPTAKTVYDAMDTLKTTLNGNITNSTQVVDSVPTAATASENVNYVVKESGGALLYRKIDGAMVMVGGAMVSVVDELPKDEDNNPDGNVFTDYYVKSGTGNSAVYHHYRWMNSHTENGQTTPGHFYLVGVDAYSKDQVDGLFNTRLTSYDSRLDVVETSTTELATKVTANENDIKSIRANEKSYRINLVTDSDTGRNTVTMSQYIGDSETGEVVSSFPLPEGTGGGGSATAASEMTLEKITQSPVNLVPTDLEDKVFLEVNYSSVDRESPTETYDGNYVLKREGQSIARGVFGQGINRIDISPYCSTGRQQFTLTVSDVAGSTAFKTWTVIVSDIRLEVSYNEAVQNEIGSSVPFRYTPWGDGEKTVHFKLDGRVIGEITTTDTGIGQTYVIPPQPHGAHLLECWITAVVNGNTVEPSHVFKDIIWFDPASTTPVIGCSYRSDYYGKIASRQYNTVRIPYVVYDPATNFPTVTISVDGQEVDTANLTSASAVWTYKTAEVKDYHTIRITCKSTSITIFVKVDALDYDISPVTSGIAFDFNPAGLTNSSENRLWKDPDNPEIKLSVSDNFDWATGGYQIDSDGSSYFCVKAGTRAYISYELFGKDPKQNGSEFKVIFMTENVSERNPQFLSCYSTSAGHDVGIKMTAHDATICTSVSTEQADDPEAVYASTLFIPYSDEDIIEFDYSIYPLAENQKDSYIMAYEDGVASRAILFTESANIFQTVPVPITIGSDNCDVRIYRMKAYDRSLSDIEVLTNFEADARDAETIVNRFERNQVHSQGTEITPESVADACPDLKVIKIDAPYFTKSKKDYIKNTTVTCIHRNGRKEDNWTWENGYHVGQGTTSDNYGKAGRNIDLIFGFDGQHQVVSKIPLESDYISVLRIEDGPQYLDGSGKITLTENSVPNNWFNIKVNIASSENANNALLQKRYTDFIPYRTPARKRDKRIKNGMEFVNCVVFIRENDPNVDTHREFSDTGWHFYALGNIGDSKKTDSTRVNDPTDMAEFVVEIHDNVDANSDFPSGVYYDNNGNTTFTYVEGYRYKYPITSAEWNDARNEKRAALYDDWDGSFEFRYDMGTKDGNTIETPEILAQQELSKQVWRDMYEFVVMSDNETFVNRLSDWFIIESPLYWYLFTERYLMIDNRAKNSFWHWGRTYISTATAEEWQAAYNEDPEANKYKNPADYIIDDAAAAINNGYRFDLWIYDTDTADGIDNNGFLRLEYGTEDIDHVDRDDPSTMFQFNGAKSIFWCRIRELMRPQLRSLYQTLESGGCWSAVSMLKEFEDWQNMFPEELWRKDIERKYMRPYFSREEVEAGKVPTDRYIKYMLNGRKRYQRRQFERYQEVYISTKYFGTAHCSATDAVDLRCRPYSSSVVPQNYTITLVPYIDMYLAVQYGTESNLISGRRCRAGVPETFTTTVGSFQDTQILIFCPDYIQEISDLSACYMGMNNFANAVRLKRLTVGNATPGYTSPYLTTLGLGNNRFLEYLDLRNCNKLSGDLDLSGCPNLKTLYAEGTTIQAIRFANAGQIQSAHLPESISSLTMRSLKYLDDLTVERANDSDPYYKNLASLISEYCAMDPYPIIHEALGVLQIVRVLGINWTFPDTDILNRIYSKYSSMLSGKATITDTYRVSDVAKFNAKWPDLLLLTDGARPVPQYDVTYVNWDGTPLHSGTVKVDMGSRPPDPVDAGVITENPTRPPDDQYEYTFSGWDGADTPVTANTVVTAMYTTSTRKYTVSWKLRGSMMPLKSVEVEYGSEAVYGEDPPVDRSLEETLGIYRVFNDWDKSTGSVKGDLEVYANFDEARIPAATKELHDMTDAERYAISRAGLSSERYSKGDYFDIDLGYMPNFDDPEPYADGTYHKGFVKSDVLLEDRWFDGTQYYETDLNLLSADKGSFTLAVDYEFFLGSDSNSSLVSCVDTETSKGFILQFIKDQNNVENSYSRISWGSSGLQRCGKSGLRNMIVLRYVAETGILWLYSFSGSAGSNIQQYDFSTARYVIPASNSQNHNQKLTFGAIRYNDAGSVIFSNRAKGWIHYAKVWYDDLGDSVCKDIVNWPREKLRATYISSKKYRVSGSSVEADGQFVLSPLSRIMPLSSSGYTTTSWVGSSLEYFAENRVYKALPKSLQSVMRKVIVRVNESNNGTGTLVGNDHLHLASIKEVYSGASSIGSDYFSSEGEYNDYFNAYRARVMFPGVILESYDQNVGGRRIFTQNSEPSISGEVMAEGDVWFNSSSSYYYPYMFASAETCNKHSYFANYLVNRGDGNPGSGLTSVRDKEHSPGWWIPATSWRTRSLVYYTGSDTNQRQYFYYRYYRDSYSSSHYSNTQAVVLFFSI